MKQKDRVLNYIKDTGSITDDEARNILGCHRLSARIYDLRKLGIDIRKTMETGVNRFGDRTAYARYWIKEKRQGSQKTLGL